MDCNGAISKAVMWLCCVEENPEKFLIVLVPGSTRCEVRQWPDPTTRTLGDAATNLALTSTAHASTQKANELQYYEENSSAANLRYHVSQHFLWRWLELWGNRWEMQYFSINKDKELSGVLACCLATASSGLIHTLQSNNMTLTFVHLLVSCQLSEWTFIVNNWFHEKFTFWNFLPFQ